MEPVKGTPLLALVCLPWPAAAAEDLEGASCTPVNEAEGEDWKLLLLLLELPLPVLEVPVMPVKLDGEALFLAFFLFLLCALLLLPAAGSLSLLELLLLLLPRRWPAACGCGFRMRPLSGCLSMFPLCSCFSKVAARLSSASWLLPATLVEP